MVCVIFYAEGIATFLKLTTLLLVILFTQVMEYLLFSLVYIHISCRYIITVWK